MKSSSSLLRPSGQHFTNAAAAKIIYALPTSASSSSSSSPSLHLYFYVCVLFWQLWAEPLGPDPKQDREMKSQTLSCPLAPFAISGIIIVRVECLMQMPISIPKVQICLRFDAFLTDLRHIERILTFNHLTVSFSVLISDSGPGSEWKCYKYAYRMVYALAFQITQSRDWKWNFCSTSEHRKTSQISGESKGIAELVYRTSYFPSKHIEVYIYGKIMKWNHGI